MPRARRIEYAGAVYHAMARGNRLGDIVRDDRDRRRFEETLAEVVEASGWVLYAWVLMSNHYHWKNPGSAGDELPECQSLQTSFRRGWYFGSEAFREKLLELLGSSMEDLSTECQKGYGGGQVRDHGQREAERLIQLAKQVLGVADWGELPKGDWRKGLAAGLIRSRSLVPNDWVARRLQMGARHTVSRTVRSARQHLMIDKKARQLANRLKKMAQAE